jgi:hypothetical protein
MKRIILGIGIILFIGILILGYDLPIKKSNVIGIYVSTETQPSLADLPHKSDTLILKSDGTFSSGFYGNGTYNIDYGILKTKIDWNYEYEMGKAGHHAYFSNKIYENPKIILNSDLNHYYEKTE